MTAHAQAIVDREHSAVHWSDIESPGASQETDDRALRDIVVWMDLGLAEAHSTAPARQGQQQHG